jgi:hypothetical protein
VEVRDHVRQRRVDAGGRLGDGLCVHPVLLEMGPDQVRVQVIEQQQGPVVAGLLDDHAVALADQV